MENYCESEGDGRAGGLGRDGGMAPYLVVPSTRFLVPLGGLDPATPRRSPTLHSPATTPSSRSFHLLGPGSTAVVIGVGGLGQMAVQLLRALSGATTIVAVDTAANKLDDREEDGRDETLCSGDDAVKRINDMTRGQAHLVLDMVGIDPTLKMAARWPGTRPCDDRGSGRRRLPVNFFTLPHECSVASPFWGSIPELVEVVSLAQAGKIQMLVEHFPLERAGEAYRLLHDGKIQGRAVITPND